MEPFNGETDRAVSTPDAASFHGCYSLTARGDASAASSQYRS